MGLGPWPCEHRALDVLRRERTAPGLRLGMGPEPAPARPLLLPPGVEAPRAGAGGREVEPDEAVERGGHAAVDSRPEALREVELEVRHRHFAREEEGDRASEEAEQDQASAEYLERAA